MMTAKTRNWPRTTERWPNSPRGTADVPPEPIDTRPTGPEVAAGSVAGASPTTPAARPAGAPSKKVLAALTRFRIAAFVVGVGLLILLVAMLLKYAFDQPWAVVAWGPIHGVLYIGYVLLAFDLAYKDRWSAKGTILVLLAGV